MGSSRLPGKMLLPVHDGKGALQLMLERIAVARSLDPHRRRHDHAAGGRGDRAALRVARCRLFPRRSEDVSTATTSARRWSRTKPRLVRLTGDCPLHDPDVIDAVVGFSSSGGFDYASNAHPPSYPDGLDTEVFTRTALEAAWRRDDGQRARARDLSSVYAPGAIPHRQPRGSVDRSALRWTLDEPADLELFARCAHLGDRVTAFRMNDVGASASCESADPRDQPGHRTQRRPAQVTAGRSTTREHHMKKYTDYSRSTALAREGQIGDPVRVSDLQQELSLLLRRRGSGVRRTGRRLPSVGRRRQRIHSTTCWRSGRSPWVTTIRR